VKQENVVDLICFSAFAGWKMEPAENKQFLCRVSPLVMKYHHHVSAKGFNLLSEQQN
jgi:hypothetical protein